VQINRSLLKETDMNNFIKKRRLSVLGVVLGAVGGYLYYHFIGCQSGTCPITSNPYISVVWGAVLGYLLLSMFEKKNKNVDDDIRNKEQDV
jgi:hypothetical protein